MFGGRIEDRDEPQVCIVFDPIVKAFCLAMDGEVVIWLDDSDMLKAGINPCVLEGWEV